ncbi:hypothetical protein VPHD260_0074 [Vibrio phage D260]
MQLNWLIRQAHQIEEDIPHYRVGQHFCNLLIKDTTTDPLFSKLWNEQAEADALDIIYEIMGKYHWKGSMLPAIRTCKYNGAGEWEFIDLNGAP